MILTRSAGAVVVRGPQLERPYVRHKDLKVGGPKGSLGGKLPLGGPVEVKNLVNPPLGPHDGGLQEDNDVSGGTDNEVAVGGRRTPLRQKELSLDRPSALMATVAPSSVWMVARVPVLLLETTSTP